MVWIPRFTLLPNQLGEGIPSQPLRLGGFMLDKYHCAIREYVGGARKAVSEPMRVPIYGITFDDAKGMAALRTFRGRPCHVMGIREWGHMAWLVAFLGHELKGDMAFGRDPRDPDEWSSFSEPGDPYSAHLTGTVLLSWFHNGSPTGVSDLLGNLYHMLDAETVSLGTISVTRKAALVNGISESDPSIEVEDRAGFYSPYRAFEHWPDTDGLVVLDTGANLEFVIYGSLVRNPTVPSKATLVDCQRGVFGTTAKPHAAGSDCNLRRFHCLIPGGYVAQVASDTLNNTNPGQVTFLWRWGPFNYGSRDASPAVGDIIACDTEDLLVTAVDGNLIQAVRGYNDTPISAHPEGAPVAKYSPYMERVEQGVQIGVAKPEFRTHPDLEELYIPAAAEIPQTYPPRPQIQLVLRYSPPVPLIRGVSRGVPSPLPAAPATMFDLILPHNSFLPSSHVGFRCAWRPSDYQYGGAQP
jgi:hypothetical protein